MVTIEPPFEINIFKYKGEKHVEIEIECDMGTPLTLPSFNDVKGAREFIEKLQKAIVNKYIVNEDGYIEKN